MYAVVRDRGAIYKTMEEKKFNEGKHFKLELCKDFPPVSVDKYSMRFSSDKPLTIEPEKHVRMQTGFYIHQTGDQLISFEPTQYYSSLMILEDKEQEIKKAKVNTHR